MDLQKFKDGDEKTWRELFHQWRSYLMAYCLLRDCYGDNAENCVTEAFITLFETRHTIYEDFHIKNRLFTVVRNRIIDAARKRKTTRCVYVESFDRFEDDQDSGPEVDHWPEVLKALELLTEKRKRVLKMKVIDGLTTHEIAKRLNISGQTVLNNCSDAVKTLKNILKVNMNKTLFTALLMLSAIFSGCKNDNSRSSTTWMAVEGLKFSSEYPKVVSNHCQGKWAIKLSPETYWGLRGTTRVYVHHGGGTIYGYDSLVFDTVGVDTAYVSNMLKFSDSLSCVRAYSRWINRLQRESFVQDSIYHCEHDYK